MRSERLARPRPDGVQSPARAGNLLSSSFFQRDPLVCAAELIGCELVWGQLAGIVVETEAYRALGDEACHTFFRKGAREFVDRHQAGDAYIYFNYGMYWLLNALVKGETDGFVLIRALEPLRGLPVMRRRRNTTDPRALCSGPGKLTQAFGITGQEHGMSLCQDPRHGFLRSSQPAEIIAGRRVGITRAVEYPWRIGLKGSPYLSSPFR